jgi:FKBP-type peptidyl-prolyl cis-trans isomerase 2
MIKNNDFIKLEYTGRIKETGKVFDTTDKDIAEKNNLLNKNIKYGPVDVCLGNGLLVFGLEKDILDNKSIGIDYNIDIKAEDAFGKKDPKNLRLVPISAFKEQKITPYPGLQVQLGNNIATVKTVTGGRCVVDFNNPLSGHDISYTYKITEVIDDKKTKVNIIFKSFYGIKVDAKEENENVKVELPNIPENIINEIKKKVKEVSGLDIIIDLKSNDDKNPKQN